MVIVLVALVAGALAQAPAPRPAGADPPLYLPPNFQATAALTNLTAPMALAFAPDGRIFVAEQAGLIKVYDSLSDPTPDIFADLKTRVHGYWDRGLMSLALDPQFADPDHRYVYIAYALDAPIGGTPPVWNDQCGNAPTTDGCVIGGRVSRLKVNPNGNTQTGPEQILIEDWCQQFPSHSLGNIAFGPDGYLYVSAGEGAEFGGNIDYGNLGNPKNGCGDPPGTAGTALTPPDAQGGALRSQSPRRPLTEKWSLDGSIIRVDPATGAGVSGNRFFSASNANARRILAWGLRNPFRFTFRPGTKELWLGDVDWYAYEELNVINDVTAGAEENFGWPCYQGTEIQPGFDNANLTSCETLSQGSVDFPFFTYKHAEELAPGDGCGTNRSSITGVAFYTGNSYPSTYKNALFIGDFSRNCIWYMRPDATGRPDVSTVKVFMRGVQGTDTGGPVQIITGPGGDLFYVDYSGGNVYRVRYFPGNEPPIAEASADPPYGSTLPLNVSFSSEGSGDPDSGDTLSYAWDLDGDGQFDDSTSPNPSKTYNSAGVFDAQLKVTDNHGLSTTSAPIKIAPGHEPPYLHIGIYDACLEEVPCWSVGDKIRFTSTALDENDQPVGATHVKWKLILDHCGGGALCHQHVIFQNFTDYGGEFNAPDHEYPSYMELVAVATDSNGLQSTDIRRLDPIEAKITVNTYPQGLKTVVAGVEYTAPAKVSLIRKSTITIGVDPLQAMNERLYEFDAWSDGGAPTHTLQVIGNRILKATFVPTASIAFSVPRATRSRTVPVKWLKRQDAVKYFLREGDGGPPPVSSNLWRSTPPATFQVSSGDGTKVIKGWALNVNKRVSPVFRTSTYLDTTPPTATLKGPARTDRRTIAITIKATDRTGITGYFLSQTRDHPGANSTGWRSNKPATFTLSAGAGSKRVYLWVRDGAGNISKSASITVLLEGSAGATGARGVVAASSDALRFLASRI